MKPAASLYRPAPKREGETIRLVAGGIAAVAYLLLLVWSLDTTADDTVGLLVAVPLVAVVTLTAIGRITRDDTVDLRWLYTAGLFLKLAAVVPRYFVSTQVYDATDATGYVASGSERAAQFSSGIIGIWELLRLGRGTEFIQRLVGTIFVVTGPATLTTYVLFSWMAFCGLFLMHRALLVGFPEANPRRYGMLLFFLPTLLYWPSSIGKDAWMLLTIGLMAYGAARLLSGHTSGALTVAAGAVLASMVRPHVALLGVAALTVAFLFRRSGNARTSLPGMVGRVVVALALVGGVVALAARTSSIIDVRPVDGSSRFEALVDEVQRRSDQGGSAVGLENRTGFGTIVQGPFTVLFRPLVFEADSLPVLLSSIEATALLLALAVCWRRVFGVWRWFRTRAYVLFSMAYVTGFVFAFSNIGNLGILARQRAQVLPFLLVLFVVPRKDEVEEPQPQPARPAEVVRR